MIESPEYFQSCRGWPSSPRRGANVIIYTPSKTWVPIDIARRSPDGIARMADENPAAAPRDEDDQASVFSMTHYGSMDWDHSGDEFENIQVTPKPRRRAQSMGRHTSAHWNPGLASYRKKPRSKSLPPPSTRRPPQIRDKNGRFARKDSVDAQPTPSTQRKRARAKSFSAFSARIVRDEKGRFKRKEPVDRDSVTAGQTRPSRSKSHESSIPAASQSCNAKGHFKRKEPADREHEPSFKSKKPRANSSDGHSRDDHGKFKRKEHVSNEASPITPQKETPSKNASGSSGNMSSQQRDKKGRFSKTPSTAKSVPEQSSAHIAPEQELNVPEAPEAPETSEPAATQKAKAKRPPAKSPYFISPISPSKKSKPIKTANEDSPTKRSPKRAGTVSCIPFPPLSAPHFGLIQEKLAHDPFRLLIAVTFLIRTHGKHAIPVFYSLMEKYPTPQSLVDADKEDIVEVIRHLGLQNSRAATYQTYAEIWLEEPPVKDKRYAVKDYPSKGSGRDIKRDEILSDSDERDAWEIGHMTQGPYAIDSWRIFCRDVCRQVARGWNGEGGEEGFQPEWMRVVPEDKELRAYLRWMWLKEGFAWDPFTGDKEVAGPELIRAAMEGRIAWDDEGGMRLLDQVGEYSGGEVIAEGTNGENIERDVRNDEVDVNT